MPDDPKKKGKPDASKVSKQKHELKYLADKYKVPLKAVREIQQKVGTDRAEVERELKKR